MATQQKIECFDSKKISLELWLSLLEAHLSHQGITDEAKKKNYLLVSVGTEVYSVLGNICAPDLPHTKGYEDLVKLLKAHYIIKPSYHRSLLVFQQRKKKPDENLNTLYAELKALAKHCNFGNTFDSRVRDQLFMAVEGQTYFPNLVAINLDLQSMTSMEILERVLNLEKAFCSEKGELPEVNVVNVGLGLRKTCKHCGFYHDSINCRFKDFTCHKCHKKGHMKRVCRESVSESTPRLSSGNRPKGNSSKRVIKTLEEEQSVAGLEDEGEEHLLAIKDSVFTLNAELFNFKVNHTLVPFEIDSGAAVSTLSESWVQSLKLQLKSCNKILHAYDNSNITVLGKVNTDVKYNGVCVPQTFYVVDSPNPNLCGKDLMNKVGIYLAGLAKSSRVNQVHNLNDLLLEYKVNANKPVTGMVAKIHLQSSAVPKFTKARTIPFHYRTMVEVELDRMTEEGIIEPISRSEWAAPIVPVLKTDKKSMRICGDFKELNKHIQCDRYPLPKIDELLSIVGKGQIFSKIDLKNAYLQLPVDEESQNFLVINTHKGLYKYKRLPFGLSSSPAIFQRFISQLLSPVEGVAVYFDDIIVSGSTQEEHDCRLKQVLDILQGSNLNINKLKSELNAKEIEYLGYLISGEGIKPSARKIKAIMDAPSPSSAAEVQSFLGMITYYCKFVRNFSNKMSPLYDLLKKGKEFKWSGVEHKAYQGIKRDLRDSELLVNFDGESSLVIEVDASPKGVGAVLLQRVNGQERPIYFASKKLSPAEERYSQIDKEGLALVVAVKKFRYFLLGRKFEARTDHKPLLGLFGKGKAIPINANARIQRWALLLSQFDFDLHYKVGKDNVIADALSRLPLEDEDHLNSSIPAEYINLVESLGYNDISFKTIQLVTKRDSVLTQLIHCLKFGWGNTNQLQLPEYASVKSELSLHNEVVLYKNRVLVPSELRSKILEHLHAGHNGISAMKAEARNWVWWPKIDQDIAELTKSCHICFKNFQNPQAPVLSWPCSGKPWSRLHIDFAGPIDNKYFLVIVDSYTKFLDVHICSNTTSTVTIDLLRKSFCNFGLPDVVVSDNAAYFVSQEMTSFLEKNGIRQVTPAPYNPSSNGLAERAVRTLKEGLKKFSSGSLNTRVCRFLYNYRKTVHSATGKSPAESLFTRNFRVTIEPRKLDSPKEKTVNDLAEKVFPNERKLFQVEDAVFARNYGRGEPWVEGKIVEVLGLRNYKVQVQSYGNMVWKRHADQLMFRFRGKMGQSVINNDLVRASPKEVSPEFPSSYPSSILAPDHSEDQGLAVNIRSPSTDTITQDNVLKAAQGRVLGNQGEAPNCVSTSADQYPRRSGRVVNPPDRLNL